MQTIAYKTFTITGNKMQFKIGDWVVQVKENYSNYNKCFKIKSVLSNNTYIVEPNIFDVDAIQNTNNQFELWRPKIGEWCWILELHLPFPCIQKVLRIEEWANCFTYATAYNGTLLITELEPFIGQLPTYLKDN